MREELEDQDEEFAPRWSRGMGIDASVAIGVGLGVAIDNIALGIGVGIAMRFGFEAINRLKYKK